MSSEEDKIKHSKRLQKEQTVSKKQLKIARMYGMDVNEYEIHRYAKHHATNCGNPNCVMCGNPRKFFNEKTLQEKSFEQTGKWTEE